MHPILNKMLSKYDNLDSIEVVENSIKQIMQEITLSGLSRSNFFSYAAFNGGTALRIFHGLNRFSEDLDFSLINHNLNFNLNKYSSYVNDEFASLGIPAYFILDSDNNEIKRAYVEGNFIKILEVFNFDDNILNNVINNKKIKIKIEVDTSDLYDEKVENKYLLLPHPSSINMYDFSTLFAGKINAILSRNWKTRVKGRDLFDFVFYLSKDASLNIKHLESRLRTNEIIDRSTSLDINVLKRLLVSKFETIDYSSAINDVIKFIDNPNDLKIWSSDFFIKLTIDYHF